MQLRGVVSDVAGVQDGADLRGSITLADSERGLIASSSSPDE
jgi:hypothetical protein